MEENTDYQIIRLPNTYYRIHIKKHMFSEDTWEHSMCIYGKKKALGKYTLSNSVIYKAFINLLNSYSTVTYEFMNCMAATEKWIRILNHVDSLKMTFVSANSFRFENDGTWRFYGFRHVYQKENHDISSVYISKNDFTAYFMDGGGFHSEKLTMDDYRFFENYVRIYFLINMYAMSETDGFFISNDTSCIYIAYSKGWL